MIDRAVILDLFCGRNALAQAVPPAFTELIGAQLLAYLERVAA